MVNDIKAMEAMTIKATEAKAMRLPEWVYDSLARKAVDSFGGCSADLKNGGEDGLHDAHAFDLEEDYELAGRDIYVRISGEIGVDIIDQSFSHEFGIEYRTGYELTGLELLDRVELSDGETGRAVKSDFDERLFARKVNALC